MPGPPQSGAYAAGPSLEPVFACGTASRATFMAIAILKSFDRSHGLVILKLDGSRSEVAAHVAGSDRIAMSSVVPGQRIRFDVQRDRGGRTFAVNVMPAGSVTGRALRGRE
jgi:cold shock CspA family protein